MESISNLSAYQLSISFIPVVLVLIIIFKWSLDTKDSFIAISRMLVQLLLIGYALAFIFESDSASLILLILFIMVLASSWIAIGTVKHSKLQLYKYAFLSILIGGGLTLVVISHGVLNLQPWYLPQYMVPLAGMIFSNSMNNVSLAAERFFAEKDRGVNYIEARNIAFKASMIPITNSLLAVGLVSLPGMMTGQILSGVEPHIAAQYQIMVMSMIFGSAGISSAFFLLLTKHFYTSSS